MYQCPKIAISESKYSIKVTKIFLKQRMIYKVVHEWFYIWDTQVYVFKKEEGVHDSRFYVM